jgi:hypothetical protein
VRATVIGDKIFAAKIDSQKAGGGTAIDWRRYNIPITPHSEIKLPNDVLADPVVTKDSQLGVDVLLVLTLNVTESESNHVCPGIGLEGPVTG